MSNASGIVKRSVSIAGHRTSVSLEAPFWDALKEIAHARNASVQQLVDMPGMRADDDDAIRDF